MYRAALATLTLSLLAGAPAAAQEDEDLVYPPDESVPRERCVNLKQLRDTEVLDDRNVLFYMRGGDIYRNVLPRRCPGLEHDDAFSYRTTLNRLCSIDVITVLRRFGTDFMDGPSCRLGEFYPVSEAEVEALQKEMELRRELDLE